jgi:hypothetical protein
MASLKVCALAGAAAAGLPIGVAGCAPGHHSAAGQVSSGQASPVRSQAAPSAIPAGSPQPQSALRFRAPRIRRHLVRDQALQAEGAGKTHCPIGGERTG